MKTLQSAHARFVRAQEVALSENNDFNELIAIGLQELTQALGEELEKLQRKADAVEQRQR